MTPAKIGLVVSNFNPQITHRLRDTCVKELVKGGIQKKNIKIIHVPGAYEIPFMANEMARRKKYKAIVCLGCIIKGETSHDIHIASWVSQGIGMASLQHHVPILFGVLTPNNEKQAMDRIKKGRLNRGKEVATAALEMIHYREKGK